MRTDEIWRWSTAQMAAGIATGMISSREAVTSCLERIDVVNPLLNALVSVFPEEALTAADAADATRARGGPLGVLHGVPTAIKVNTDQAGHPTTDGVVGFAGAISPVDSVQVAHLRAAGAVIVGRSNCPAFSFRWDTDNDLHGRTRNPWDGTRTAGGSSGGAASAVASGMLPLGHGNDLGGSIRYPAFACGVAGIRPTVGKIAGNHGPRDVDMLPSFQTMGVQGMLARTSTDLRLGLQALAGYDPRDPLYAHAATAPAATRPYRVGLLRDVGVAAPDPAVDEALTRAAGWLGDAGYLVEEVELPLLEEAYRLWYLLVLEDFRTLLPAVQHLGDVGMRTAAEYYFAIAADWWGPAPGLTVYQNGWARRNTLMTRLQQFLEQYPLVVLPVSAEQPFEHDRDIAGLDEMRRLVAAQWAMMAIPVLGVPALSVPTGVTNGLPVGVQLLGRRFDEHHLLTAGEIIEARAGCITPIEPMA
ncbi:MAG: amidase [Pseudonocardia sp.]